MDVEELKDLLAQFSASKVRELSFDNGKVKLSLSKNQERLLSTPSVEKVAEEVVEAPTLLTKETQEEQVSEKTDYFAVKAPLIGTFYLKPAPEEEDFISVGQQVVKGDVLGIIEAMKVMNEIISPVSGIVKKIAVKTGDIVEYDSLLVEIQED